MNKYAKLMYRAARLIEERSLLGPDEKWLIAELCMGAREIERQEPGAYISHTSEGDILGWERQFDAPSHTPLTALTHPQPAPDVTALVEALRVLVDNGGIGPESMFDDARAALADYRKQGAKYD